MKYKDLIKRLEPYAEEEVDMVASNNEVIFFPLSDGDCKIVHLAQIGDDSYMPEGVIEVED